MASLVYEISTHIYDKTKYLKPPGKDENGNPAEPVDLSLIHILLWFFGCKDTRNMTPCVSHGAKCMFFRPEMQKG